jgi:putative ABC transport system permease protein
MEIKESIRIALQSLWANKLRSVLTLLGVVIGIAAVIAVVTFVNGINGYVSEKIFRLGADVFIVSKTPNVITDIDTFLETQKRKNLKIEDYEAVRDACRSCVVVAASVVNGRGRVKYGMQSLEDSAVRGWTPTMATIYDLDLVAGRAITDGDVNNASNIAIIGYDIFENVLGGMDPINREIRVDGQVYRVVGLGKKEGKTLGQSRDNWVAIPISAWFKQYGANANSTSVRIYAKAPGVGAALNTAMDETRVILRSRRHDVAGKADSFNIDTNASFLSIWANISSTFFGVTIAIASISLLVGGIVIMNIMLVSVTERTREIGIRKALGAKRADVMSQFLIESGTMAVVGGILGIIAGVAVAKSVTFLIGMPSRIELWSVLSGLFVSATVGIFFGVYPARRAAMLDPIVALRSEL